MPFVSDTFSSSEGAEYILYSVGENGMDEGGRSDYFEGVADTDNPRDDSGIRFGPEGWIK